MYVHTTVLLEEAINALALKEAGTYIDGTFGRGGHSKLILQYPIGHLFAFDKDPAAIHEAYKLEDSRFHIIHASYIEMKSALTAQGIQQVDGILLDLGMSSPQLDDPSRGFSFRNDGPLDMRMNPTQGLSAQEWLAQVDVTKLAEVIKKYGEERYAVSIAKAIVARREAKQSYHEKKMSGECVSPCDSTRELATLVASVVRKKEPGQDPATRTFQAIRIYLNRELEELSLVLVDSLKLLAPGGRLVVISFHSLEDRIVKHFMQKHARPTMPEHLPRHLPLRANQLPPAQLRLLKKIQPSKQEITANPRARSAIMRIAEKLDTPEVII